MNRRRGSTLRVIAIILAITVATLLVPTAHARMAFTGSVKGLVRSTGTNTALSGVTVRVLDAATNGLVAEARTDEDGVLVFEELPFGRYQVMVVAPEGYAPPAGHAVELSDDAPVVTVDFDLEPLPDAPRQSRRFPLWAVFAVIGSLAAVVAGAVILGHE